MTPSYVQLDDRVTFNYVETTIPPGLTMAAYRRARPRRRARRVVRSVHHALLDVS